MSEPDFGVELAKDSVRAWNTTRLSFEPKGEQLVYRAQLRQALLDLKPSDSALLCAEYATPDSDFADLENVLLYNLGWRYYRHLAANGLVCRRIVSGDRLHHVVYHLRRPSSDAPFKGSAIARAVASKPAYPEGPAGWWAAFRPAIHVLKAAQPVDEFTVTAEIGTGWNVSRAVSSLKPMLDGLISALHAHDGSNKDHIVRNLEHLSDPYEVWEALNNDDTAVLGQRRLVRPHGKGIAWNPADERCSAFRVVPGQRHEDVTITVTKAVS